MHRHAIARRRLEGKEPSVPDGFFDPVTCTGKTGAGGQPVTVAPTGERLSATVLKLS